MWSNFFADGGFTMVPILVFGFCLVAAVGLHALRPQPRLRAVAWNLAALVGATGLLGLVMAMIATVRSSQPVEWPERSSVLLVGFAESANNLVLALLFLGLAALGSAVAAWREGPAGVTRG